MNSSSKKINDSELELTIELGKEDLDGYVTMTEDKLSREVEVKGFRKGKVSKDAIRKEIGAARILEEALDLAMRDSLAKVVVAERLDVVDTTDLKIIENTPIKLLFSVKVTVFPVIKIGPLDSLKIKRKEISIEDSEIGDAIKSLRNSRASFSDSDDPIKKNDRVEVDYEVSCEGKTLEGGVSKNHPLVVGSNSFIPGFEDQLLGLKKDEEKRFSIEAPVDYYKKEIAGKQLDFVVKITRIQNVVLPELNDEFASSLGKFKDLAELRENVKAGLLAEKKDKEKQRARLEVLKTISEKFNIPAPEFMVKQQLEAMIKNFDGELHKSGLELGLYLAHINKTQDDLKNDWKGEAEKQVRILLALHGVSKENNIFADDKEVEEATAEVAKSYMADQRVDAKDINLDAVRDNIRMRIQNDKTLDWIERNCVE
ncbi:MAG: Trigger factor [Parcubacteria group bacterium GW2011_GWC1_39_29]|nr:MAG: Trigger factor [Parcubacteria group bacterium GW2011_GWC1_39_29]